MSHPASLRKSRSYPGKVAIRHAVEAARELGLDIAGYELSPDGTIRVFEARANPPKPQTDFDRFEAEL